MNIITVNVKIVKYNFHYSNLLDWKIGNVNAYILRIIWFVSKIPMETDWKVGKIWNIKLMIYVTIYLLVKALFIIELTH